MTFHVNRRQETEDEYSKADVDSDVGWAIRYREGGGCVTEKGMVTWGLLKAQR